MGAECCNCEQRDNLASLQHASAAGFPKKKEGQPLCIPVPNCAYSLVP